MPAPISVIIPTLNAAPTLGPCLASLIAGVTEGLVAEVIISDGGSTDDTQIIAKEVGAVFMTGAKGRGTQLHAAAQIAKGEWLLVLHADTVLSDGWVNAISKHLQDPGVAGYGRLKFDDQSLPARFIAGWANLRSRIFGLPYGDQTLLISQRLYQSCGGYPDIPLMEDVAISRSLRGKKRMLSYTAITRADRYQKQGWFKRGAHNLITLCLYLGGKDPVLLSQRYQR